MPRNYEKQIAVTLALVVLIGYLGIPAKGDLTETNELHIQNNEPRILTQNTTNETQTLPQRGLVLHLTTAKGVITNENYPFVQRWEDQSGLNNDLFSNGTPLLIQNSGIGQPAIIFDGEQDLLQRTTNLSGFPTDDQSRTIFYVVRYRSEGVGGIAYGNPSCNEAFGLVVNETGKLAIQGWCPENDFPTNIQGTGTGWMIHSATITNNTYEHFQNGSLLERGNHTFSTGDDQLVIGGALSPPPYLEMNVAEVLLYNRSLSATNRQAVEDYLQNKYFNTS